MNFNSKILKVSIVIALVLILIPIAAAEDASSSVYGQDQGIDESVAIESQGEITDDALGLDVQSDVIAADSENGETVNQGENELLGDEENPEDDEYAPEEDDSSDGSDEDSADLSVDSFVTPQKLKVGDYAIFTFVVTNNGPGVARNVVAYANLIEGDVLYISSYCDQGEYNSYTGIWEIGDLESGESVMLMVLGKVLSTTPLVTEIYVTSDTPDPDESNNIYYEFTLVEGENQYEQAETLPATGNPILMVLLAALTMVGVTISKRD